MSSTIKQAILALKSRVADAFAAVEAKGGTLPATQDSANLPSAIASIPSGGGTGLFDNMAQYGVSQGMIDAINLSMYGRDLDASLPIGYKKNVPFVVCEASGGKSQFENYSNMKYLFLTSGSMKMYLSFYLCRSLQYIVFAPEVQLDMRGSDYLLFGYCGALRGVLGKVLEFSDIGSTFQGAGNIEEIYIRWTSNSGGTWMRNLTKLLYACVLFTIQNLGTTPNTGATFAIGQKNLDKLNATQEGQDAIAAATANGWTIAA